MPLPTKPFDDFYGIVLEHVGSGPMLWSAQHQAWLRGRSNLDWHAEPVEGDEVVPEQHAAALSTIDAFLAGDHCRRCGREPEAAMHYLALDIFDVPEIYCLQRPPHDVVGSGHGEAKHVGSPFGCAQVKATFSWTDDPISGRRVMAAGHIFGAPLTADDVLSRLWCRRCRSFALRPSSTKPDDKHIRFEMEGRIRLLTRALSDYNDFEWR